MAKALKYQWLINKKNINEKCPFDGCTETTIAGYRWIFSDLNHEDNFLPVILLDEKHGRPPRKNSEDDNFKCSGCALSMFNSADAAIKRFKGYPERIRKMLGFTHMAVGTITNELGIVSTISASGHFDYFEYEEVTLVDKFKIVQELNEWNN